MAISDTSNILQVDLPAEISLLEVSSEGFVDHLFKIASTLIHAKARDLPAGVMLLQRSKLSDFSESWLKELRSEVLVCELTRRILRLRALQAMIQLSPVEWCWAGKDSCLGSWFDLALSCHRRIWLSTDAILGFPELDVKVAPWGFSIDLIQMRIKAGKEIWEQSATMSIVKGASLRLIDAVANTNDPVDVAQNWFRGHLRLHYDLHEKRERVYLAEKDAARQWAEATILADDANRTIQFAYSEEKGKVTREYGADFTWQLQRDRSKSQNRKVFESLTSFVTAKSLISRPHVAWLSGQTDTKNQRSSVTVSKMPQLFIIDLNAGIPPASCILKLIEDHRPVILVASSNRVLTESLSVLFSRLEKSISGARASVAWDRFVSWFVGPVRPEDVAVGFSREEFVAVKFSGNEHRFYRLEGNHPAAPAGWCEAIADSPGELLVGQDMAMQIVKILSDGVVVTEGKDFQGLPLFAVIRLLMFEELHKASTKFGAEFDQTLEGLKSEGWGFVAHAAAWERFLPQKFVRMAAKSVLFDELTSALFERGSMGTSGATSLRQVREIKRPVLDIQARRTSALRLSQHLLYFVGTVDALLAGRGLAIKPEDRRRLVREAAGLPTQVGSPHSFVASRGKARTLNYLRVNWPSLVVSSGSVPGILGEEA